MMLASVASVKWDAAYVVCYIYGGQGERERVRSLSRKKTRCTCIHILAFSLQTPDTRYTLQTRNLSMNDPLPVVPNWSIWWAPEFTPTLPRPSRSCHISEKWHFSDSRAHRITHLHSSSSIFTETRAERNLRVEVPTF